MLQYIINSTAIWLTGLLIFDLFLRREAMHGYNRVYLVTILLAGALIPIWSLGNDSVIYSNNAGRPIAEQTAAMRDAIVSGSEQELLGWEQWLQIIYLAGIGVCSILLLKDLLIILKMYRKGDKSKDGTWTIVETGANMSPFSAFRVVFISAKADYTKEELAMVLAHEEQHGHLLHFIDVLIIRLFQILFWFNPMIYLLEKRLLLVHEYQADMAVDNNPSEYGRFLVEQSVLNAAPVLAHSFIRSPLKKRILMLTRKTTSLARGKQLLIAPVLLLSLLCFTKNAFSGEEPQKDGNKITYKGNVIEYSVPPTLAPDTVEVRDPSTGEMKIIITRMEPTPIKINGEQVYNNSSIQTPGKYGGDVSTESNFSGQGLKVYLLTNMDKEIKKLDDGTYTISVGDIIIDKKGAIVFFTFGGINKKIKEEKFWKNEPIEEGLKKQFAKKISRLIEDAPRHRPADIDGKPVYSTKSGAWGDFTVKDGKLISL